MPATDEEAKAKLVEYKESASNKIDAASGGLHGGIEDARAEVKAKLGDGQAAIDDVKEDAEQAKRGIVENVEHYSQAADQKAGEYLQVVKASANNAQLVFDDGLTAASNVLKSGATQARCQYSNARARSQEIWDTAAAHTESSLDTAFDSLKGSRRFLWRQTIGRLRSEEGIFKASELKATHLKQNVTSYAAEQQKLEERLAAAQTQYAAGLAKLVATNRQLQALQSNVSKTEQKAQSLIDTLRELPSAQALKLRAEVAMSLAAAKVQRNALDRQVYKLSKKGF